MLTRVLGVDIQAIYMTMLALVGLYLVLTHARELNAIVANVVRGGSDALIILQGRSPRQVGRP